MKGKFHRKRVKNTSRLNRLKREIKEKICCEKNLQNVSKNIQKFEENNKINDQVLFNFLQKNPGEYEAYLLIKC
jgi:hypothetical protein